MEAVLPTFDRVPSDESVGPPARSLTGIRPHERATLALVVMWIAVGLAVDTRRHRTDGSLDTFFTSAHALLYAGWLAAAVFVLYVLRTRQAAGATGRACIPRGFGATVVGAALFGIGGLGDLIWHTVFGIETDLKILFSPTHLLLMTAMVVISFGVVRSSWLADEPPTRSLLWPAALSTGVIISVLLVFFQFVSAFDRGIYTTAVPELLGIGEIVRVQAVTGVVVLTVLFYGPLLLLGRRWNLPVGSATLAFAVPALSNFIFTDFQTPRLSAAVVAGGVISDVLWLSLAGLRTTRPRLAYRLFGAAAPLAFWCLYLAITIVGRNMRWPAELWTGSLLWSGLVGSAITVLLLPPLDAPASWLDQRAS